MSGVYIEMEMPKNCNECPFFISNKHDRGDDSLCLASGKEAKCGCPLVPVPDHGRLVDADALEIQDGWLSDDRERNVLQTHITFVYSNDIINAPTIIPAEGIPDD